MCKIIRFTTVLAMVLVAPSVLGSTVVPGGSVSGIWSASGSPYLVQGDIAILSGTQLSITPGVEVVFEGLYQLDINGSLQATGAAQDSVVFTASDQEVGWAGIRIPSDAELAVLDHCIIEYGRTIDSLLDGGGIYCRTANLTLTNSRISNNRARYGGGIYILAFEGSPAVSNCIISHNVATRGGGIYFCCLHIALTDCLVEHNVIDGENGYFLGGGGIWCDGWFSGSAEITGCTVRNNLVDYGDGWGAGIAVSGALIPGLTIANCDIVDNTNGYHGGGGVVVSGAQGECEITNCRFSGNSGPWGLISDPEGGSALVLDGGHATISRCTFDHNYSSTRGTLLSRSNAVITAESCSFSHNMDNGLDGGGALVLAGDATITNTIISNQQLYLGSNHSSGINFVSGTHSVRHCDLFGNSEGVDFTGPAMPAGLGTITGVNVNGDPCDEYANISLNSLFCGAPEGDLQIAEESPCLGAGEDGVTIGALGIGCSVVGVPLQPLPETATLAQNYPNPFNPRTHIEFFLARAAHATIQVFDARGRRVATLVNENYEAGRHEIVWQGTDDGGARVASGVYRYQLVVDGYAESKRMVVLK